MSDPRHEELSELVEVANRRKSKEQVRGSSTLRSQSMKLWWPVFIPSYAGRDLGVRPATRSERYLKQLAMRGPACRVGCKLQALETLRGSYSLRLVHGYLEV